MPHPSAFRTVASAGALASLLALAAGPLVAQAAADSTARAAPPAAKAPSDDSTRTRRLTFGLQGGFAQNPPFDPWGAGPVGYAAQAVVELRTPLPGVRVRGDGLFASWGTHQHVTAVTAGLIAEPTARWRALPYVLGSGGGYAVPGVGRAPGWSLGAGVRIPMGRQSFVLESRLHAILVGDEAVRRALGGGWAGGDRWQYTHTPLLLGVRF